MGYLEKQNKEIASQEQAMNKLLIEMVQAQRETIKRLMRTCVAIAVCFTLLICSILLIFLSYERQFDVTKETITETIETTLTQEVSGENSEINNVQGDMYKDNAVHNSKRREDDE